MNVEEFKNLSKKQVKNSDLDFTLGLINLSPRTLIYGKNTNLEIHHLYIVDKRIHLHIYDRVTRGGSYYNKFPFKLIFDGKNLNLDQFLPDLYLYPECCDFEFCKILKDLGLILNFSLFVDKENSQFYGECFSYDSV